MKRITNVALIGVCIILGCIFVLTGCNNEVAPTAVAIAPSNTPSAIPPTATATETAAPTKTPLPTHTPQQPPQQLWNPLPPAPTLRQKLPVPNQLSRQKQPTHHVPQPPPSQPCPQQHQQRPFRPHPPHRQLEPPILSPKRPFSPGMPIPTCAI